MVRLENIRGSKPLAVLFIIAAACGLIRRRRFHLRLDDLTHKGFLVGLAAAFPVGERRRFEREPPRFVQQKLADDKRARRFVPGGGG